MKENLPKVANVSAETTVVSDRVSNGMSRDSIGATVLYGVSVSGRYLRFL